MIVRVYYFGGYLDVYKGSKTISTQDDSCDETLSFREVFPRADHRYEVSDSTSDPSQYSKAEKERYQRFGIA
jgi:hypothetical protein